MHRCYRPLSPITSVLLKQKWDKDVYNIHRRKVHAAKAVIDNCAPKIYNHCNIKLKKLEYEAIRAAVIKRDNRLHSDKVDLIMRTGGWTDHQNDYQSKSLNSAKHKRELVRIAKENRTILKCLGERDPNYNHKQLLMDWQQIQNYLRNISKYPPPAWTWKN